MMRNPMQPLIIDENGLTQFKENKIVGHFVDKAWLSGFTVHNLDRMMAKGLFTQDDYEQFCQLIGYSLSGYHELCGVSDESALEASKAAVAAGLPDSGCRSTGCGTHCGVKRK